MPPVCQAAADWPPVLLGVGGGGFRKINDGPF